MFSIMSDWSMAKDYNGAECFSDGSRPLLGEAKFADVVISGIADKTEVFIGVYPNGELCDYFYEGNIESKELAEQIGNGIVEYINAKDYTQFTDGSYKDFFKTLGITNIRLQDYSTVSE